MRMMGILKDVLAELLSMFITDARLTVSTLILVGAVALLIVGLNVSTQIAGAVLLVGCVAIVVEAAFREAKARARL
jgi:hypothetical protein